MIHNKEKKQFGIKSVIAIFNEQPYEKAKIWITKPNNKKVSTTEGLALREIKI